MRNRYFTSACFFIFAFGTGFAFAQTSPAKKQTALERAAWELMRQKDPVTGEIPPAIRAKEVAFSNTLPKDGNARGEKFQWKAMGPRNVGGRTREMVLDINDENHIVAGGISGGIWYSEDGGQNWTKATVPDQHHSITCIIQDPRPGKTNNWYYGSGEALGNSASKSFSAYYLGNGVYHSSDNGMTWQALPATVSGSPQVTDDWDRIWRIAIDPSEPNQDILYAALPGQIMRSDDGGATWSLVLGGTGLTSYFTDVEITPSGIVYATLSSNGNDKGVFRSEDGINWTNINPSGWPSVYDRIVVGIDPSNENNMYFLAETPGSGQLSDPSDPSSESNSLWRYEYLSGNGAGSNGNWTNLSMNLPADTNRRSNFRTQGGYDMAVAVKPDDPNTVFIGGTSIFRSTDGFTSTNNTTQLGGYLAGTEGPWGYRYPNHHPDIHDFAFLPSDPDVLFSASDGGIHRTDDCMATTVVWDDISEGYITSQFYTVAVDHSASLNPTIVGGLQDNGSQWTNSDDPNVDWVSPNLGDGAFCAIEDGGGHYYFSRQFARIIKATLNANGERTGYQRIDPDGASGYLFIPPYILDPKDNDIMYLAAGDNLWRNDDLSAIPLNDEYEKISTNWTQMTNLTSTNSITTLEASRGNPDHRLYYGTSSRRIYRIDSANTGNPVSVDITGNINSGAYTSDIAIDPRDADKLMVVYSNYNVISLWYSEDAGQNWESVSGNLEENVGSGFPAGWGNGPSCRAAAIIPVDDGKTVYLVGTSTGLYATADLMGDSTVWVQQGSETVGNVVVDMIDFRQWDGFTALATHGNGVYTSFITKVDGVTSVENQQLENQLNLRSYPNPAEDQMTIAYQLAQENELTIILYDQFGRPVLTKAVGKQTAGPQEVRMDIGSLASGIYYYQLRSDQFRVTRKFVKQ